MEKIPTLFLKIYDGHKLTGITREVRKGMEWVLEGKGQATIKMDGQCCAKLNGRYWRRYDAKPGRVPPEGAIPCGERDKMTGHWPHWVKINLMNPQPGDRWLAEAIMRYAAQMAFCGEKVPEGTYEAIGPHFNSNPYGLEKDTLARHGQVLVEVERSFEGIRRWLEENEEEGLVFWLDGKPRCKIRREDFGLEWPIKRGEEKA